MRPGLLSHPGILHLVAGPSKWIPPYANLCGGLGIRVTKKEELDGAIAKALEYDGPSMVEVMADADLV